MAARRAAGLGQGDGHGVGGLRGAEAQQGARHRSRAHGRRQIGRPDAARQNARAVHRHAQPHHGLVTIAQGLRELH